MCIFRFKIYRSSMLDGHILASPWFQLILCMAYNNHYSTVFSSGANSLVTVFLPLPFEILHSMLPQQLTASPLRKICCSKDETSHTHTPEHPFNITHSKQEILFFSSHWLSFSTSHCQMESGEGHQMSLSLLITHPIHP